MKRAVIGVMGSGVETWEDYVKPLAQWIADNDFHLLTGGGGGVMAVASASFSEAPNRKGGLCIGVVPTNLADNGLYVVKDGYPNRWVDLTIVSPLPSFSGKDPDEISRNHINILSSDVLIALPGSKGTRNEVDLSARFQKPIILYGPVASFAEFPAALPRTDSLAEVTHFILAHAGNRA